jgi:hypothetical protein
VLAYVRNPDVRPQKRGVESPIGSPAKKPTAASSSIQAIGARVPMLISPQR